ncbi:MAG: adenylate/guanylate cyclase domain-containing protein [Pseudomonadota bacterium]
MISDKTNATERLRAAERQGLRLAVLCRTIVIGAATLWFVSSSLSVGDTPNLLGLAVLATYFAVGLVFLAMIGTRFEHPALKFAVAGADMLGAAALFAVLPLSDSGEVPQILVYRAYGIYYLVPLVALSTLALSWRLVLWTGLVAVIGWWSAFLWIVARMDRTVSWGDLPPSATAEQYAALLLSPDFIGSGNRIEETGMLVLAAAILALTVYRARQVFFAQISAEAERTYIAERFGEYVPRQLVARLLDDPDALEPQVRRASVICVDIAGFTTLVERSTPKAVIGLLNAFFAEAAEITGAEDGLIVGFTGDGFIAAFNAPLPVDEPETRAVSAARALLSRVETQIFGGQAIRIRIGLATGEIAAGSVGGGGRQTYTVYGDTVNLSARLQDLAKDKGVTLLMDGITASAVGSGAAQPLGEEITVRGRAAPVQLFVLTPG